MKHNKKRNTAFLYEALVQELTKAVVEKNKERKNIIVDILREHFSKGRILHAELSLYRTINESRDVERRIAEKILSETKNDYSSLPKNIIFNEQTRVINKINKKLGVNVFSNFIPNYKNMASLSQILNNSVIAKERVLLEETILNSMCSKEIEQRKMASIDNITYNTFINKFNEKYGNSLLEEQKNLITNYLVSFSDNGISLKIFLNEEISRLKKVINEAKGIQEIREDKSMLSKTDKILEKLELFSKKEFNSEMLSQFLKIQYFVNEAMSND